MNNIIYGMLSINYEKRNVPSHKNRNRRELEQLQQNVHHIKICSEKKKHTKQSKVGLHSPHFDSINHKIFNGFVS